MIKSIEKAFRLIETLANAERPMRLKDIADANGMTSSNTHRMLQTLQDLDYVRQCPESLTYELTLKSFEIGARAMRRDTLLSAAHPAMVTLSEQVGENVLLSVRDGTMNVVVDRIESRNYARTFAYLGARAQLNLVSAGKMLLAHAPEHIVDTVCRSLEKQSDLTVTDPDVLRADLVRIRAQDHAIAVGEVNGYVKGVACPIRDRHGLVVAALSVSGPMERLSPERIEEYVGLLRDQIRRIEANWSNGLKATASA